jgi:peroxiredoxin
VSEVPAAEPRPAFTHKREKHGLIGPFTGRQLLLAAIVVVVAGFGLAVITTPLASNPITAPNNAAATPYILGPAPSQGLRPGSVPPELELTAADGTKTPFKDLDGNPISLAELKGKAVWINFFASWCPPCQSETPVLRDIADRYKDRGLAVVGISVQETSADDVRAYAERYQLDYTIAADLTGEIFRDYRLWGLPTSFFIAPDGGIRSVVLAPLTEAGAQAQVEAILPKP